MALLKKASTWLRPHAAVPGLLLGAPRDRLRQSRSVSAAVPAAGQGSRVRISGQRMGPPAASGVVPAAQRRISGALAGHPAAAAGLAPNSGVFFQLLGRLRLAGSVGITGCRRSSSPSAPVSGDEDRQRCSIARTRRRPADAAVRSGAVRRMLRSGPRGCSGPARGLTPS